MANHVLPLITPRNRKETCERERERELGTWFNVVPRSPNSPKKATLHTLVKKKVKVASIQRREKVSRYFLIFGLFVELLVYVTPVTKLYNTFKYSISKYIYIYMTGLFRV